MAEILLKLTLNTNQVINLKSRLGKNLKTAVHHGETNTCMFYLHVYFIVIEQKNISVNY